MCAIRDLLSQEDDTRHYSVHVNIQDVLEFDPQLGYMVLHHPVLLLNIFEEAILRVQMMTMEAECYKAEGMRVSLPLKIRFPRRSELNMLFRSGCGAGVERQE